MKRPTTQHFEKKLSGEQVIIKGGHGSGDLLVSIKLHKSTNTKEVGHTSANVTVPRDIRFLKSKGKQEKKGIKTNKPLSCPLRVRYLTRS